MCGINNQSGRSMIEMLGVLAIIGVLSVGGIAGYSKAMMKFKINKSIDQISQIVANTRTLYARQKNYANISNKIMYKANLAPKEMFEDGSGSYGATNPFGGKVEIFPIDSRYRVSSGPKNGFTLQYSGIPDEACIELVTQDWGSDTSSGLLTVGVNFGTAITEDCRAGAPAGELYACPNSLNFSIPVPVDWAVIGCECGNSGCDLFLSYK